MSEIQNPYQVLGIERTADERAVKKAYFALVRKFPPETHPDEFQKIRAAYELLSDAAARARFDEAQTTFTEYAPQVAERLAAAEEAAKNDNDDLARTIYMELLVEDPKLSVARERLALSWLRGEKWSSAIEELDQLLAQEPDNARHHFHRGVALGGKEEPGAALLSLRRAVELEPGNLPYLVNLVDCLSELKKFDEALDAITEGEGRLDKKAPGRVTLSLRRIDVLYRALRRDRLEQALAGLDELVRDFGDPELPPYLASQLAADAARLFADDRFQDAELLLAAARRIHPAGRVERPLSVKRVLGFHDLPAAAQGWLRERRHKDDAGTVDQPLWLGAVLLLFGAAFALVMSISWLRTEEVWDAGDWVLRGLAFAVSLGALLFTLRSFASIMGSPLRRFTTLHPLYLLEATGERVTLYSLLHLRHAGGVHNHTNGVYTNTQINLTFEGAKSGLSIRGKELAEEWLNLLNFRRNRALNLLAGGLLDAEHGMEGFAPADLEALPERKRTLRSLFGTPGAVALLLLTAIATGVAVPMAARAGSVAAEEVAFAKALADGSIDALGRYVAAFPSGRTAESARREIASRFDEAEARYAAEVADGAEGAAGLREALSRLRAASRTEVPVSVTFDGQPPATREVSLGVVGWMARLAGSAGLSGALRFVEDAPPAAAPVVRLEVSLSSRPGPPLVAGAEEFASRAWQGRAAIVGADGRVLVDTGAIEKPVPPSLSLEADETAGGTEGVAASVERRLRADALAAVKGALARRLGLAGVDPRAAGATDGPLGRDRSPYQDQD